MMRRRINERCRRLTDKDAHLRNTRDLQGWGLSCVVNIECGLKALSDLGQLGKFYLVNDQVSPLAAVDAFSCCVPEHGRQRRIHEADEKKPKLYFLVSRPFLRAVIELVSACAFWAIGIYLFLDRPRKLTVPVLLILLVVAPLLAAPHAPIVLEHASPAPRFTERLLRDFLPSPRR